MKPNILESALWLLLIAAITVVIFCGCEPIEIKTGGPDQETCPDPCQPDKICPYDKCPPVDLPKTMRQHNYGHRGSCAHAAMIDVLRWQGRQADADWWRKNYRGGAWPSGKIASIAERRGLDYAKTSRGDPKFLEWCSRTRRGAAISWSRGAHAITFCGYVNGRAVLIDNNSPHGRWAVDKRTFLASWLRAGGDAITPVYSPPAPRPWL